MKKMFVKIRAILSVMLALMAPLVSASTLSEEGTQSCSIPSGNDASMRVILDPATHTRWLSLQGEARHGGPGSLRKESEPLDSAVCPALPRRAPSIRAGDSVQVREDWGRLAFVIQATALNSAAMGERFAAAVRWSPKPVQLRAIAPGKAEWVSDSGIWK